MISPFKLQIPKPKKERKKRNSPTLPHISNYSTAFFSKAIFHFWSCEVTIQSDCRAGIWKTTALLPLSLSLSPPLARSLIVLGSGGALCICGGPFADNPQIVCFFYSLLLESAASVQIFVGGYKGEEVELETGSVISSNMTWAIEFALYSMECGCGLAFFSWDLPLCIGILPVSRRLC